MRISREQVDIMIRHAQASAPNEACGLLAGQGGTVAAVHCLENADQSPFSYELTADGYRLLIELDDSNSLLAVFHSHTYSEAYPSPTDRRRGVWPICYVLVSLMDSRCPIVRGFRILKRDPLDPDDLGEVDDFDDEEVSA